MVGGRAGALPLSRPSARSGAARLQAHAPAWLVRTYAHALPPRTHPYSPPTPHTHRPPRPSLSLPAAQAHTELNRFMAVGQHVDNYSKQAAAKAWDHLLDQGLAAFIDTR